MKKVLFLTSALIMSTMLFAEATTVDIMEAAGLSASVTLNDDNNPYQIGTTPITLTGTKGDNNFPAINYNANKGTDLRFYKGTTCSVTFEADGNTITKIEFLKNESTASAMGSEFSVNVGTLTENVWEGEATAVTFSYSHTENFKEQAYIINVTYTKGEGGEGEGGEGEGGEGEGGDEGGEGQYIYDENSTFSANFTADDIVLDEDYFEEYGDVYLDATNADNQYLSLDITDYGYADGVFTPGVYEINDSYEDGTVYSGFYDAEWGLIPSFAGILDNEDYVDKVWYIVSGTVTISDDAIVVDAVNSLGKSVTANITLTPMAVENTEANVQSAIKTLRNGQVLIRKNNKVYTILGQEVK